MSTARRPKISVEEYLAREAASPDKHEFYQGVVFAMAGGSPAHNRIASNIHGNLFAQLRSRDCLPNMSDVLVNAASLDTYSDVSVVCQPVEREPGPMETLLNPRVLIEVLSPTTERHDRNVKFPHYRRMDSVREILLVQQDAPVVERYIREEDGRWTLVTTERLDGEVLLTSIDCRLAMQVIYANVEFPPSPFGIASDGSGG